MKKKLGLVCFVSQPGKTTQTFCGATFNEQVEIPIRALLVTGILHKVLVVVMCSDKDSPKVEKSFREYLHEEGLPLHTFTPTSVAVHDNLRDEWEKGRVDALNVMHPEIMSATRYATAFIKGQGVERILVKFPSDGFPTEEKLRLLSEDMEANNQSFLIIGAEHAPKELLCL